VIRVRAERGVYQIDCRWGALDELGTLMRGAGLAGTAFVVSDDSVAQLHGDRAMASLSVAGFDPRLFLVPPGEPSKSLDTVRDIYGWLLDGGAERRSPLVALGGGVVGDLAGFAAATYLRGIPFVQAPTSLLAMVDASIGGKTGVDHPRGKNLIGAFYPPRLVVQDTSLLVTLPPRSLREGFAEVIKHALIMDAPMLETLEHDAARLLAVDRDLMTDLVARNVALKASVASEDEQEGGRRMILNYGHTVGHALEAVTGYATLLHGEAISVGMMAAARIGERMGLTPPELVRRQSRLLDVYGLPTRLAGIDVDAVIEATSHDKKVAAKRVRWVLLEDAGHPVIRDDVPRDLVRDVLRAVLT